MTQLASLLAVATVFLGLWTLVSTFHCQAGKGGCNCGILRYFTMHLVMCPPIKKGVGPLLEAVQDQGDPWDRRSKLQISSLRTKIK